MNLEAKRTSVLRVLPLVPVAATCVVSLVLLRSELVQVPYLNDSAMHEEMVRFALARILAGHLPLDSWFPFLNLGSPQYLHYQSLAAMLTALVAWPIGVGRAFTLTTWLLVGCWPLCIYSAALIFGMSRGAAAASAVLSPFVSSFTHVGYEQISYLWDGYGLWTQLWAMWTLPFAWALSWRAVEERRFVMPAAVMVAATAALHFETGYLAFAGVAPSCLSVPRRFSKGLGARVLSQVAPRGCAPGQSCRSSPRAGGLRSTSTCRRVPTASTRTLTAQGGSLSRFWMGAFLIGITCGSSHRYA